MTKSSLDKRHLLTDLTDIYMNLGHLTDFAEEIAKDAMTYNKNLFILLRNFILTQKQENLDIKQSFLTNLLRMINQKILQKEREEVFIYILYL